MFRNTPEFQKEMKNSLLQITKFVNTESFQHMLQNLYDLPKEDRMSFVNDIILNPEELSRRQIHVPDDMIIQKSMFGDGRPTLFCVTNLLADPTEKVTFTFYQDPNDMKSNLVSNV